MNDNNFVLGETAALLSSLRGVFDEEWVDELDHALQAAGRASVNGADDELVLASALHDLGRSPLLAPAAEAPHDVVARRYDDGAKVPGAQAPSIEDVLGVARRVLAGASE
ncbi:hypothetical protein FK531_15905 [Rhodococcus spelaei]|uniref:HD domain-containing protein n=1 Tax=Rhodococcus spelaei TaxID=2546320 RepID=A0A541B417_9NOCA|nr:hypothetical protein [Rhodococcus spelaei]TQF67061.1 hypothetical protein FK531_15905 [Rhodococcus spelaei]